MSEPRVPVSVLADIADEWSADADSYRSAAEVADDDHLSAVFAGKADGYDVTARRLRELVADAETEAGRL